MDEDNNHIENPFRQQLMSALENFTDAKWLGMYSPLATLYFLGEHLVKQSDSDQAAGRGRALQKFLQETAQRLIDQVENGDYLYRILQLTFFQPQPLPQILYELGISKSTYYRAAYRPRAVQQLEKLLIGRLKPALRLEEPPRPQQAILGRKELLQKCLEILEDGKTTAVTGNGGVGKTLLGAHIANQWRPRPSFWFTLRPGLNDQLNSFLFSLGYFLQHQAASVLWLQMVAGADKVESEVALGLIRRDLESLQTAPPLFCIDEIDLLRPSEVEEHTQLLAFLSSLRGLTPILFMGQHVPVETDWVESLAGLPQSATRQMLTQADVHMSSADLATLQAYTEGNPRLLKLFLTLHQSGESLVHALPRMSKSPSLEFLLNRIWQRLHKEEQNLLAALSVFRRPAPYDAWSDQATLDALAAQSLVHMDEQGGVNLLPAFKAVIYNQLSPELREALHLDAAIIRATHGEYTTAAYHYIRGGQAEKAIWLWYTHRQQEIDQGQGRAALELFAGLSRNQFDEPVREVLVLLRSELRLLFGNYREIRTDLYTTLWRTPLLKGRANRIEGDVAYEQSRFDDAVRAYRQGQETVGTIGEELALFHKDIGKAYWQMRDLAQAWHESLLARYEVEHLQGNIQEAMGNYAEARRYYEEALALAQKLNFIEGEGKTRNNLAWVLFRQGEAVAANQQWDKASDCYQRVGRLTWQAGIKINQAHYFKERGQLQTAIALLENALSVFESLGHTRGSALATYHLAEAYLLLTDTNKAEHFAWESIQKEEISLKAANLNVLARIRLAQKQAVEAEVFCQKSIQSAEQNQDLLSGAYSWRTLGEACLAQEKIEAAAAALEKAKTIFQDLDLLDEVESTEAIVQKHNL